MEAQSSTWKVGLFVVAGLIAVMGSILALDGDRALLTRYANLKVKMEQVQGLNEGSIVSLSGIRIGNVETFEFAPGENALLLTLKVEAHTLERIPVSSTVEVRTQGALGDKYVYISPGPLSDPRIPDGGELKPAASTDLLDMLSQRGSEAAQVFDILTETRKLLASLNHDGRMDRLMTNLAETSNQLKAASIEARALLTDLRGENPQKVQKAIAHLESILGKVDRGEGSLGALINDPSLHEQLKNLTGGNHRKKYLESILRTSVREDNK